LIDDFLLRFCQSKISNYLRGLRVAAAQWPSVYMFIAEIEINLKTVLKLFPSYIVTETKI